MNLVIAKDNELQENATRRAMRRTRVGDRYMLITNYSCSIWQRVRGGADLVEHHKDVRCQHSAHGAEKFSVQVFANQTGSLVADYNL
jgi:hypothetical protein